MVSGYKKNSNKKFSVAFAKDKKQAIAAVVVAVIFLGNLIRLGIVSYQQEHPQQVPAPAPDPILSRVDGSAPSETPPEAQTNDPSMPSVSASPGNINNLTLPNQNSANPQDISNSQMANLQENSSEPAVKSTLLPGEEIEIIPKKGSSLRRINTKKVTIVVDDSVRLNPFLPTNEVGGTKTVLPYLTAPPEVLPSDSDAGKVMTTTISGILYDKYSPSAIINIEGADYLVKKGDVINKYKILSIGKTQVLVQLGKNIYCAGVGELLSQTNVNYNTIANLNKKFGGNDIPISIRKKGY